LATVVAHDRAGPDRLDDPDGRRPERADDHLGIEERQRLVDLLGGDQLGVDAPGPGAGDPPGQLLHPLGGPGDFVAAGLGEDPELLVLPHAVGGDVGHLPGVVDREDEVARVPGGAARVGQRPLVELHEVPPAEPGQVVGEAVADDAGADDDGSGAGRQGAHDGSLRG
jgi:hypothetical protein